MPYIPYRRPNGSYGTFITTEEAVAVAKAIAKAPRSFWHYMRDGLGEEHAEEEERKRQAIIKHRKEGN